MKLRAERTAVAIGIYCAALATRLVWWPRVFSDRGPIAPQGADEYYHLRRIVHAVENFPEVLEFDSTVNFPQGGEIVWPPLFDFAVAALAKLLGAQTSLEIVAIAMWVPPVLGVLLVLTALWIATRAFGWTAGWIAGALLAVLPGAFRTSQLGMVDHHVAAALFSALLFGLAMAVARQPPGLAWPRVAVALGLCGAAFQLTWMGALLPLALLQALAALWILHAPSAAVAVSRAQHVGAALTLMALALFPFAWGREWSQFDALSPLVLTSFHPLWFGGTGLVCLSLAGLWRRAEFAASVGRRWLSGAVCGALGFAAVVVAAGDPSMALDTAAGWFRQDEAYQHFVEELRPFFREVNGSRVAGPERQLTRLIYATPLLLLWLGWRARAQRRADWWLLFVWCAAAALATFDQQRFLNSLCAPFAVAWGAGLASFSSLAATRFAQLSPARRIAAFVVASSVSVWIAAPSIELISARARVWREGAAAPTTAVYPRVRAYRQAALWLRENSPATAGTRRPEATPEYGVVANWSFGHLLRFVAQRAQLQDNFGVYGGRAGFDAAERYYAATDEAAALRELDALRVRYVLVDRDGSGHARGYSPTSMTARLIGDIGSAPAHEIAALARHRLRFETSPRRPGRWHVMLWEIVPGALIEGVAEPSARIRAELNLRSSARQIPTPYRAVVRADAQGNYRLRVPYPTGGGGSVMTSIAYRISSRGREANLTISEAAVAAGERIAGPRLVRDR